MKYKLKPNSKRFYKIKNHPFAFKIGYAHAKLNYGYGHVSKWQYFYLGFFTIEVIPHYIDFNSAEQ